MYDKNFEKLVIVTMRRGSHFSDNSWLFHRFLNAAVSWRMPRIRQNDHGFVNPRITRLSSLHALNIFFLFLKIHYITSYLYNVEISLVIFRFMDWKYHPLEVQQPFFGMKTILLSDSSQGFHYFQYVFQEEILVIRKLIATQFTTKLFSSYLNLSPLPQYLSFIFNISPIQKSDAPKK